MLTGAAGGAAGAAALRAAGYNVGYGAILASSLALGIGVYTYEMWKQAKERGALLAVQMDPIPGWIPSPELRATNLHAFKAWHSMCRFTLRTRLEVQTCRWRSM